MKQLKYTDYLHRVHRIPPDVNEFRITQAKKDWKWLNIFLRHCNAFSRYRFNIAICRRCGIMNIMLVSVSERTREIGIRMAIGAKRRDILSQFLIESITLSGLGGIIGILLGLFFYYIITYIVDWPYIFSFTSVIISFLFSCAVGVFFGYYPAKKASDLKPIEALRYE
jgi:ABC-type lipoprotein release transport system permease subunit